MQKENELVVVFYTVKRYMAVFKLYYLKFEVSGGGSQSESFALFEK